MSIDEKNPNSVIDNQILNDVRKTIYFLLTSTGWVQIKNSKVKEIVGSERTQVVPNYEFNSATDDVSQKNFTQLTALYSVYAVKDVVKVSQDNSVLKKNFWETLMSWKPKWYLAKGVIQKEQGNTVVYLSWEN